MNQQKVSQIAYRNVKHFSYFGKFDNFFTNLSKNIILLGNNAMFVCMTSCFNCVQLCVTLWTVACQALYPWDPPGKTTVVGCNFLFQGIFLTWDGTCISYIFFNSR